jgi:hypothetical protein
MGGWAQLFGMVTQICDEMLLLFPPALALFLYHKPTGKKTWQTSRDTVVNGKLVVCPVYITLQMKPLLFAPGLGGSGFDLLHLHPCALWRKRVHEQGIREVWEIAPGRGRKCTMRKTS